METELKPCPFCGAAPLFVQRKVAGAYPFHVRCPACEATAGGTAFQNNAYNAEQWNRRAKAALTEEHVRAVRFAADVLEGLGCFYPAHYSAPASVLRSLLPAPAKACPQNMIARMGNPCRPECVPSPDDENRGCPAGGEK
jgi:Lar family restriction alleviation protein